MKALLAAIRCEKGDIDGNRRRHLLVQDRAVAAGCDVVVFPEMSLTGSCPAAAIEVGDALLPAALTTIVGIVENGSYITQVVARGGQLIAVQRKRHLGDDEEEYTAAPDRVPAVFDIAGVRCAIAICAEAGVDFPFADAAAAGASVVFMPSAPGLYGRRVDEAGWRDGFDWWRGHCLERLPDRARRYGLWIAVTSQAGSTIDEDFPGWAALIDPHGQIAAELPDWREGELVVDVPVSGAST